VYWKNFTSKNCSCKTRVSLEALAQIRRGIKPGKGLEIVDEMRLVEITATKGNVGPIDGFPGLDLAEDLVETPDPAEQLRGHTRAEDHDSDSTLFGVDETAETEPTEITANSLADMAEAGAAGYHTLKTEHARNFDWLRPDVFVEDLAQHLEQDAQRLFSILELVGRWQPEQDYKLAELQKLLAKKHPAQKILIFSQFADTVSYLAEQLQARGIKHMAGVTGDTEEPSEYARRFSPDSNKASDKGLPNYVSSAQELSVLVATDVLSEGQNLQDATIVVNFDLPWAIIRLIQRAGRVDRIGQKAEKKTLPTFTYIW
jgi:hypothetical protein